MIVRLLVIAAVICAATVWSIELYARHELRVAEDQCLAAHVLDADTFCVHYRADGSSVPVRGR